MWKENEVMTRQQICKLRGIGKKLNDKAGANAVRIAKKLLIVGHPYPSDKPGLDLLKKRSQVADAIKRMRKRD